MFLSLAASIRLSISKSTLSANNNVNLINHTQFLLEQLAFFHSVKIVIPSRVVNVYCTDFDI